MIMMVSKQYLYDTLSVTVPQVFYGDHWRFDDDYDYDHDDYDDDGK